MISQCLTETHKLKIGAPLDDLLANGEIMLGSSGKAFLLVDPANHKDAVGIERLFAAKRPEKSGGRAADRDARADAGSPPAAPT